MNVNKRKERFKKLAEKHELIKISIIFLFFFSINLTYAKEGLTFSTSLNKQDSVNNPATYSSGEELRWDYILGNQGQDFNANVCFFLKVPNGNLELQRICINDGICDITDNILRKANQQYGCVDENNIPVLNSPSYCPIRLGNIKIGNTNNQGIRRNIFSYRFPSSFPEGQYQLIAQFRDPSMLCSNENGIISIALIKESLNYFEFKKSSEPIDLRSASIQELPFPKNFYCFSRENENNPQCSHFYKEEWGGDRFLKVPACPFYYNPVCGADGLFYPSACWAEQLSTSVSVYGYCNSMKQFISDLWLTKKEGKSSFAVSSPDIEFTYSGSGFEGWKNGVYLRSTLWRDYTTYSTIDFNIKTYYDEQMSTSTVDSTTFIPVIGNTPKALLVYVVFDDTYPEQILLEWTQTYTRLMNDYIKKKQRVPNPIQYNLIPIVINRPASVERLSESHLSFSDEEKQKIYDAAVQRTNLQNFQILIVSPIQIMGVGGIYSIWNGMGYIEAPLAPYEPYSVNNKKAGIDALFALQNTFVTISHEILHALGLPGDHVPMGYGTRYLEFTGQDVDSLNGKSKEITRKCDFFGGSPDYYAVELPNSLKLQVGEGLDSPYLIREESISGDCLCGFYINDCLKDYDRDGEYELMYKNNLIGIELQRSLGWVDIDGDNIAEIIDSDAYGGVREVGSSNEIRFVSSSISKFEPVEEVNINNCKFERVRLENGMVGLVPLRCVEFNSYVVNIYKDVRYNWEIVQKDYGTVLLPRLG